MASGQLLESLKLGPHIHLAKAVGRTIVLGRTVHRLSQTALADKVHIPVKRLRAIERGEISPTLAEYGRIRRAILIRAPKKSARTKRGAKK